MKREVHNIKQQSEVLSNILLRPVLSDGELLFPRLDNHPLSVVCYYLVIKLAVVLRI
jgi:hypothetical protein